MMLVLLCGPMLAGCATKLPDIAKLTGGDTAAGHAQKQAAIDKTAPTDLEGGVRQAQAMRLAGHYDDAIHVLSQLMLVASDDPRVVSEYGKTLAEKGRAQDAVEFLNRAIELSANDWTLYSALGVSYDQLGNQVSARAAYEHALSLRPEEPSVLNNYALSRMLAGDTDGARQLIGRAQLAGGASDPKIASNIALLNKLDPMPAAPPQNLAMLQKPAAARAVTPVMASSTPPARPAPQPAAAPVAQNAPRAIVPSLPITQQPLPAAAAPANGVVMQAVPFDPLAGPVKTAGHAPRMAETESAKAEIAPPKIETGKDVPTPAAKVKTADAGPVAKADGFKPAPDKAPAAKTATKDAIPALRLSANAY